ncbi:VCBS repeat-containing protein [bacterium]|nr:VCBS repeat-containing protein [bacterium]
MSGLRHAAAFLLFIIAAPSAGQSGLSFRSITLRFGGPASLPILADVDGDGWTDLTAAWRGSGDPAGTLAFFRNRRGSFAPIPDSSMLLPADAVLFDLLSLAGDSGSAVWILTPTEVRSVGFLVSSGATADAAFPVRTAFPGTAVDRPAAWPFASTLSGHEDPVFLIPTEDGLRLFRPVQYGTADSGAIAGGFRLFRSSVRSGAPAFSFSLPVPVPCDWDADGTGDAALVLEGDAVLLFSGSEVFRSDARPAFESGWGGDPARRSRHRDFEFRDFNADGLTDVLVIEAPAAGLLTPPGWARLHLNRKTGWDAAPDQVLVRNRFFGDRAVADFNGDGRPDLCLVSLESGPADIIQYGLTRRVKNRFDFHYGMPDGRFLPKPDRSVTVAFNRTLSALFAEPLVVRPFAGDFDGDGREDVGLWASEDELRLMPAGSKGPMEARRTVRLRVPRTDHVRIEDLNCDGFADLVLCYPDGRPEPSCVVLLSAGGDG